MAVTTIINCDRCGDRITQERTVLKPTLGRLKKREPFDLCCECSDLLLDWFGPLCGRKDLAAEAAMPDPAPPTVAEPATDGVGATDVTGPATDDVTTDDVTGPAVDPPAPPPKSRPRRKPRGGADAPAPPPA